MMDDVEAEDPGVEVRKTICWPSPGCHCNCGLLVRVKDNKILNIKGNPEFPYNRGAVCAERMPHFRKWLDHPDQLMHPLKRRGERGENQWERVSWEQALDEIAAKLQTIKARHGAESLSTIEGTYRSDIYAIRARFLNLFGNPANVGASGTACACNKVALSYALAGANIPCILAPPIKQLNCLVLLGRDYTTSNPVRRRPMQKWRSQKPEARLIVIDPRQTEMAKMADMWLQIRPGTDAALLMAWINVIIARGLYDREFVDQWTYGFERLKQRAAEYTPERVAEITWIPADQIVTSAISYAGNKPGCINSGLAPDQFGLNSIRVEQAKLCLHAITGNMRGEAPGLAPEGPGPIVNGVMAIRDSMMQMAELCPPPQRAKQLGSDRFKLMTWPAYERINALYEETYGTPLSMSGHSFTAPEPAIWRSIIDGVPYPTKALITWGSNPLLNAANTRLVYRALKSPNLDLHVVLEHFMTPTALQADYVLPAASKFERGTLSTMEDFTSVFVAGERAITPMGERKTDYYFFRELAVRLGFGEHFPWKTEEELYNYRLQPFGITFEEAAAKKYVIASAEPWTYDKINPRTGKTTGFATRSGKFELYSNLLEELGYDPLPYYEEPPESPVRTPEIAAEFPLILIDGGRFLPQFQSEHRQFGMGLREQHPDPLLQIHPDTAAGLRLAEGDWASIETPRGAIIMKAHLFAGIDPRVVHAEHCWWFPEQPAAEPSLHGLWQSNVNVLTTDELDSCDQVTGSWPARALLCRVNRITPTCSTTLDDAADIAVMRLPEDTPEETKKKLDAMPIAELAALWCSLECIRLKNEDDESFSAMLYFDALPHDQPERALELALTVLGSEADTSVVMQLNDKFMHALLHKHGVSLADRIEREARVNARLRWLLGGCLSWLSDDTVKARLSPFTDKEGWRRDDEAHDKPKHRIDYASLTMPELARAWVEQYAKLPKDHDENWFALGDFVRDLQESNADAVLDMIIEILKIETSDQVLAVLAAGELEDVISAKTIDRIEREAAANDKFRWLLGGAWYWHNNSESVKARLDAIVQGRHW